MKWVIVRGLISARMTEIEMSGQSPSLRHVFLMPRSLISGRLSERRGAFMAFLRTLNVLSQLFHSVTVWRARGATLRKANCGICPGQFEPNRRETARCLSRIQRRETTEK
jgi:hypothetical protein